MSQPERPGGRGEARNELVPHRAVDVHPLHRDAQLTGAGERRPHRPGYRPGQVGVGQDEDRVLPAEFHRVVGEPRGRLGRDDPPDPGAAGEHQEVAVLDQRRPEFRARAGHHLQDTGGQAGLLQQFRGPQRGVRRLPVRLGDDRIAREERRKSVADAERQRVVPRGDDADHALRVVILPGLRERGQGARAAPRLQVTRGRAGVVPAHLRDVDDLLEGMPAGFAVLQLDQVEHLILPAEQALGETQQHLRPVGDVDLRPAGLRLACNVSGCRDILRGAVRHMPECGAGRRHLDRDRFPGARRDRARRQPGEQAAGDPRAEEPGVSTGRRLRRCRHGRCSFQASSRRAAGADGGTAGLRGSTGARRW